MDEVGEISSVIEDHVERLATRESAKGLLDAPGVLFLGLSLPGEDGNASGSDTEEVKDTISMPAIGS